LNVDSVNLTIYLWREQSVRVGLAANAANFQLPKEKLASNPEQTLQEFRDQFTGLSLPIGWVVRDNGPRAIYDSNCQLFPGKNQAFGIPIVMPNFTGSTTTSPDNPPQGLSRIAASLNGLNKLCITPPQSNDQTNFALKLFGILLTAMAARQGAPFWFDILKRLVNV